MSALDALAGALRKAYEDKLGRGKVVSIHLFGIEHSDAIDGVSLDELTERAGVPQSYKTEIRKGVVLAKYVQLR